MSSLGVGGQQVFSLSASVSAVTVSLGDFAENQGEHYVSLEQVTVVKKSRMQVQNSQP